MGSALASGTGQAKESAIKARASQQTDVLAVARKQAASNQQSLSRSASIDSNLALAKYNAKQSRRAEQLEIAMGVAKAGAYKVAKDREGDKLDKSNADAFLALT